MCSDFTVIEGSFNLPTRLRGAIVAIGNFDGVHKGHQYLLQHALDLAKKLGRPSLVLTFEPHPRMVKHNKVHYRLTTIPQKYKILARLGFCGIIEQPFNTEFMELTPKDFIEQILIKALDVNTVVVGTDFCFGKDRRGDVNLLKQYVNDFDLYLVDIQKSENLRNISSSYIRNLLCSGQVDLAAKLLNYHYNIEQIVIHGAKLGREIGFPTANMELSKCQQLAYGIYAVKIKRANGDPYDGVASFGKRPTIIEDGKALLETYIFDFEEEIYGEYLQVSLFKFLRPELKFNNLEELKYQIADDVKKAKYILQQEKPLSKLDEKLCF